MILDNDEISKNIKILLGVYNPDVELSMHSTALACNHLPAHFISRYDALSGIAPLSNATQEERHLLQSLRVIKNIFQDLSKNVEAVTYWHETVSRLAGGIADIYQAADNESFRDAISPFKRCLRPINGSTSSTGFSSKSLNHAMDALMELSSKGSSIDSLDTAHSYLCDMWEASDTLEEYYEPEISILIQSLKENRAIGEVQYNFLIAHSIMI